MTDWADQKALKIVADLRVRWAAGSSVRQEDYDLIAHALEAEREAATERAAVIVETLWECTSNKISTWAKTAIATAIREQSND